MYPRLLGALARWRRFDAVCHGAHEPPAKKAAYLDTGTWAHNAVKEARLFGDVDVVASSEAEKYSFIPKGWSVPQDADYFHFTSNNTIYGTEMRVDPTPPRAPRRRHSRATSSRARRCRNTT